jgi:hypothetical protein
MENIQVQIEQVEVDDLVVVRKGYAVVSQVESSSKGPVLVLGFENGNEGEFQYKPGEFVWIKNVQEPDSVLFGEEPVNMIEKEQF